MNFVTHGWGWMWSWWVLLAIGSAVVVWLIVRANRPPPDLEDAEELLRRRFAAGEIDEAEFEGRLLALRRPGLRHAP